MRSILILLVIGLTPNLGFASSPAVILYQAVAAKVYTISGGDERDHAIGSAVAVSEHLLATTCHIGSVDLHFKVKIADHYVVAKTVYADKKRDLCLLTVTGQRFIPVDMLPSTKVTIGEDVYAIANPYGIERSITRGIITNKRPVESAWVLQTDATLETGSSGGGLFNADSQLIGIIYASHRLKNIGFVMPVEWVQSAISTLP